MNAYNIFKSIRDNLNEASAAHWGDPEILHKLNLNYRKVASRIGVSDGDYFLKSADLTPSSAKITLPSDCMKPVYMEANDYPISLVTVRERRVTRPIGASLETGLVEAYFEGTGLVINMDSFTDTVTLWYQERIPLLHCGTLQASTGATALYFQLVDANARSMLASGANDYYNDEEVETIDISSGIVSQGTISDYAGSTGVATVATMSPAPAATDYYGTVLRIPEEANGYLELLTTVQLLAKPSSAIDPKYFEFFAALLKEAKQSFDDWLEPRMQNSSHVVTSQLEY